MRYEKNPDLIRFLRENTNLIISTFHRSGTRNLRILKHAINDFEKIFDMVNKSHQNTSNRVIQTMLIFTIAVSFEIKTGRVIKEKFVNIKDNEEYKAILVSSRVLMDNRQFYIKEFDNNYYYNFKAEYRFFKFIEYYIRTRIFDMKLFKENMEAIQNTVDIDKLPAYRRLLTEEYWKIPDEQFPDVIDEILANVKEGTIELIDMVKIFAYFSYFSRKGLIDYDLKSLKSVFFNGMNKSCLNSKYCPNVDEELGKIAIEEVAEDMQDILMHFNNLNAQLLDKKYKDLAEKLFKCIPMKMETFYELFDKECMDVPIFKYYDPYQLFQRISCGSNEDIVRIKEKMSIRAAKKTEELQPEMQNIATLKQIIDDYLYGKPPTIKLVMFRDFSNELEIILKNFGVEIFPKIENMETIQVAEQILDNNTNIQEQSNEINFQNEDNQSIQNFENNNYNNNY
ncbi:MAG: hypothetical protein IKF97_03095 [Clostridia bacterium]|nr:hypothetical protein [Clostridia bacterium]